VFRFDEIENAGNAEFGGELRDLHHSLLFPEINIAGCGAAAPSRSSARRCRNSPRREAMQMPDGGRGNTGGSNFRGADDRVTRLGPPRAIILSRNACDGRR
jgi:hypothetical protein